MWPGNGWIGNNKPTGQPLSWAADRRTLAFQLDPAAGVIAVRLLDTATPGGSLRSSKLAVEWAGGGVTGAHGATITGASDAPADSLTGFNTLITPNGAKIICVTAMPRIPAEVTEFSVSTGKIARVLDSGPTDAAEIPQDVFWTNSSGSTLIVQADVPGVLTGNQFTPIPGASPDILEVAW